MAPGKWYSALVSALAFSSTARASMGTCPFASQGVGLADSYNPDLYETSPASMDDFTSVKKDIEKLLTDS